MKKPWEEEEDCYEFKFKGFDCLIIRNPIMKNLCGYVGVKEGHPWFEKPYQDVEAHVHGGLTYSDHCQGHICHKTENEDDNVWWLGFDCGHWNDFIPKVHGSETRVCTYKTVEYVRREIEDLARQAEIALVGEEYATKG